MFPKRTSFIRKTKFTDFAEFHWGAHATDKDEDELELLEALVTLHESPGLIKAFHYLYSYLIRGWPMGYCWDRRLDHFACIGGRWLKKNLQDTI
jgi:hypothetical protein